MDSGWEIEITVTPRLEWSKVGIASFVLGNGDSIAFRNHENNSTILLVTVNSEESDIQSIQSRAKYLLEAFLGLVGLESERSFSFRIGAAHRPQIESSKG